MLEQNIVTSYSPTIEGVENDESAFTGRKFGNDYRLPDPSWRKFEPMVQAHGKVAMPFVRDMAERFIALLTLILVLPLIVIIGILIKYNSPGPALFRQWRVGAGGRVFRFTKFRTFLVDSKERFPDLYAYSYSASDLDKLCFKVPSDPRMTRLGSFLRQSTLDELPNFWHVLTGEMSMIGPRPEIPEMLPYYSKRELKKFTVRPGISGQAQISGRGLLGFRETVEADLQYVEKRSPAGDIRIALLTIYKVFLRQGAF